MKSFIVSSFLIAFLWHGPILSTPLSAPTGPRPSPPADFRIEATDPARMDVSHHSLDQALSLYRELVARGGWEIVPGAAELMLIPDEPRLPALRRRLLAEGDLVISDPDIATLRSAVQAFQERHGLDPDGRVGRRTLAELKITAEQRLRQISINLERRKRLPEELGERFIVVNAASAELTLVLADRQLLRMRVIVGDTKHPTPIMTAMLSGFVLNPPWNVPASIATNEILPRLKRNPAYLASQRIRILNRPDDPFGLSIDWRSVSPRHFSFRLQQQPGPDNALGRIKFDMPNAFDVFLHDTPNRRPFARSDRALSHGCIRLELPVELAAAMGESDGWTIETLDAAIATGETRRVALAEPLPVYLVYFTAFVDRAGRVNFRHDLYGRDRGDNGEMALATDPRRAASTDLGCPDHGAGPFKAAG